MDNNKTEFPFQLLPDPVKIFIEATSKYTEAPDEFLAGSCLFILSTLAGPRVRFCNQMLNEYFLFTGTTGFSKKTTSLGFATKILSLIVKKHPELRYQEEERVEGEKTIHIRGPKKAIEILTHFSIEGAQQHRLGNGSSTALTINEYQALLSLGKRSGQSNTIPEITSMYDGKPISLGTMTRNYEIEDYAVNLAACSTEAWLGDFVNKSSQAGGFANRHLLFSAKPTRCIPSPQSISDSDWDDLAELFSPFIQGLIRSTVIESQIHWEAEQIVLSWESEAALLWSKYYTERTSQFRDGENPFVCEIAARELNHALKMAGLRCWSELRVEVNKDDLLFGIALSRWSSSNMYQLMKRERKNGSQYPHGEKILEYLMASGNTSKQKIARRIGGKQEEVNSTLLHLEADGLIEINPDGGYQALQAPPNPQLDEKLKFFSVPNTWDDLPELGVGTNAPTQGKENEV